MASHGNLEGVALGVWDMHLPLRCGAAAEGRRKERERLRSAICKALTP
jgi:hypothetical protein